MTAERPVDLPLPRLFAAMPITATVSILHRATGIVLFIGSLFLFHLLQTALDGPSGFDEAEALAGAPLGKLALWLILSALAFHLFAGVRHLLMDFHVGDSSVGGRAGAWLALGLALAAALLLGAWLW